jgi:hypothetical protein
VLAAPRQLVGSEHEAVALGRGAQHEQPGLDDLGADPVSGDHGHPVGSGVLSQYA